MRTWIPLFILLVLLSSGLYAQGAGNALAFDGTDYVDCGTSFLTSSNLTIEAWVRPDGNSHLPPGGDGFVISDGDGSATGVNVDFQGSHVPHVIINTSTDNAVDVAGSGLSENSWSHVAFVFNGSSIIVYQNGSPVNTYNLSVGSQTIVLTSNNLIIGGRPGSSDRRFLGDIDEVRIWNAALTQPTISNWMNVPVTGSHPNYTSMLAYYKFDEDNVGLTSGTCVDSKASYDGTNNGATWFANNDLALPVELSLFEAMPGSNGKSVELRWVTESETDNLGFNILRREGYGQDWQKIDGYLTNPELAGQGTVSHTSEYNYVDNSVDVEKSYQYVLANIDVYGNVEYSQVADISLTKIAAEYQLFPAFPNPFNPETVISFNIPVEGQVAIQVYDMNGRLVRTLVNGITHIGNHRITWDGRNNAGAVLASGVYFVKLETANNILTQKVTLVR